MSENRKLPLIHNHLYLCRDLAVSVPPCPHCNKGGVETSGKYRILTSVDGVVASGGPERAGNGEWWLPTWPESETWPVVAEGIDEDQLPRELHLRPGEGRAIEIRFIDEQETRP